MRVCKRGHELKPENTYVRPNGTRTCRTCRQASAREYRQRNLEKYRAYDRAYRQRNPQKRRARNRAYYQRNSEKIKAYARAYYEEHRKDHSEI